MTWTNRTKPTTSWETDRDSIGDFRITEDGNFRITENSFMRILEFLGWDRITKPITNWVNRVKP